MIYPSSRPCAQEWYEFVVIYPSSRPCALEWHVFGCDAQALHLMETLYCKMYSRASYLKELKTRFSGKILVIASSIQSGGYENIITVLNLLTVHYILHV